MPRSPLTPARRARLEKLAAYLEGLPKRYRHFDMADFIGDGASEEAVIDYVLHNGGVAEKCGTVACALGHGPAAGILATKAMIDPGGIYTRSTVNWSRYSALFLGELSPRSPGFAYFEWLFSGDWDEVDNHHYGAAARIRYILAGNPIPDGFLSENGYADPQAEHRKLYAPYRIDAKVSA